MYMYVIMCIYVYGPVAVNTINELNWIEHYDNMIINNNFVRLPL